MTKENPEAAGGRDLTDAELDEPSHLVNEHMRALYRQLSEQDLPDDPPFDVAAGLRDLENRLQEDAASFRDGAASLDEEGFISRTLDAIAAMRPETGEETGSP